MSTSHNALPDLVLEPIVRNALMEDLGPYGDVTTRAVVLGEPHCAARIQAREDGIVSGMQVVRIAFHMVDQNLKVNMLLSDGCRCRAGDTLMEISGNGASILSAERVALNLAGRMSGVATLTARYVAETRNTDARITCTRKTTPGLRILEKQAVLHGGGYNHRFGLSDAILIKDNHVAIAGGVAQALAAARSTASHMLCIEIEVDNLQQLNETLRAGGAHAVLLDNMDTDTLSQAVAMVDGRLVTEASGNIRLERVAEVAGTGVDYISSGALTHSAPMLDIGLDL